MQRFLFTATALLLFSAPVFSQIDTASQEMVSMANATGKMRQGQYTYFKNGDDQPFTGVLYAQFANGNFESIQEFRDGVGNGTWVNYYENGALKEVGTYVENRVEGPIKKYYPSGKIQAEGTYRSWRIRVDEWTYYDENGQGVKTEDYGQKGDFRDVEDFYRRGEISRAWYEEIMER